MHVNLVPGLCPISKLISILYKYFWNNLQHKNNNLQNDLLDSVYNIIYVYIILYNMRYTKSRYIIIIIHFYVVFIRNWHWIMPITT